MTQYRLYWFYFMLDRSNKQTFMSELIQRECNEYKQSVIVYVKHVRQNA